MKLMRSGPWSLLHTGRCPDHCKRSSLFDFPPYYETSDIYTIVTWWILLHGLAEKEDFSACLQHHSKKPVHSHRSPNLCSTLVFGCCRRNRLDYEKGILHSCLKFNLLINHQIWKFKTRNNETFLSFRILLPCCLYTLYWQGASWVLIKH